MNLADRESLHRIGPAPGREPGRDSHRSEAKKRRSPEVIGAVALPSLEAACAMGLPFVRARVLARRGPHTGYLRAIAGGNVPAGPSVRAKRRAGLRARDVDALRARGCGDPRDGAIPGS